MTFILTPTKWIWNLDKHDISTFSASKRPVGTAYETLKTHCSKANNAFTGFTKEVGALLAIVVRCEEDIWYQESRIQQEWAGLGRAFMSGGKAPGRTTAVGSAGVGEWVAFRLLQCWYSIGKGLSPRERRDVYSLEHTFAEQTQRLGNVDGFRIGIDNSAIICTVLLIWRLIVKAIWACRKRRNRNTWLNYDVKNYHNRISLVTDQEQRGQKQTYENNSNNWQANKLWCGLDFWLWRDL